MEAPAWRGPAHTFATTERRLNAIINVKELSFTGTVLYWEHAHVHVATCSCTTAPYRMQVTLTHLLRCGIGLRRLGHALTPQSSPYKAFIEHVARRGEQQERGAHSPCHATPPLVARGHHRPPRCPRSKRCQCTHTAEINRSRNTSRGSGRADDSHLPAESQRHSNWHHSVCACSSSCRRRRSMQPSPRCSLSKRTTPCSPDLHPLSCVPRG